MKKIEDKKKSSNEYYNSLFVYDYNENSKTHGIELSRRYNFSDTMDSCSSHYTNNLKKS